MSALCVTGSKNSARAMPKKSSTDEVAADHHNEKVSTWSLLACLIYAARQDQEGRQRKASEAQARQAQR